MALTPKKTVNPTNSVVSPVVDSNKTVDPEKVSARIRKIIENYPERHRRTFTSLFAAMIANIPVAIFEENDLHDMTKMIDQFLNKTIISDGNIEHKLIYVKNYSRPNNIKEDTIMSVMLPSLPPFTDVDSVFKNPYPLPGDTVIKMSSIRGASPHSEKLEFADDAKVKLLEIATTLQGQVAGDFAPQRIYLMLPVIKAVAFIAGHKKVMVDDLFILDSTWHIYSRRDEFVTIVDSIVSNFSGIAEQFRVKLAKVRTQFSQARSAVSNGQNPNYWDDTIPSNWSLDDVIVNCINDTSLIEAELITLTDGKNQANKAHAQLFAVLDEAKSMKKMFANTKGIKI
jgi:hypothetical protein